MIRRFNFIYGQFECVVYGFEIYIKPIFYNPLRKITLPYKYLFFVILRCYFTVMTFLIYFRSKCIFYIVKVI